MIMHEYEDVIICIRFFYTYDAIDPAVARTKLPDSQRAWENAVAIGPVRQRLKWPIN